MNFWLRSSKSQLRVVNKARGKIIMIFDVWVCRYYVFNIKYFVIVVQVLTHGLLHSRLLCPSLFLGVCSNSCPLSQQCHPTISSFFAPFSSCPQSFPPSGFFPMSQLFTSGGASASASVLSVNFQG